MTKPKDSVRSQRKSVVSGAPQVIGGRLLVAGAILLPVALLRFDFARQWVERYAARFESDLERPVNQNLWQAGKPEQVGITLIAADYDKLACAYDRMVGNAHCQYKSETELWPSEPQEILDDNKKNIIQPFSLVPDNQLVLLAGIWAQPAVALRVHQEPPSVPQKKQSRFIARCRIRPVERVTNVSIRWEAGARWGKASVIVANEPEAPPWVAVVEHCDVADEEE